MKIDRRKFLKAAGVSALASLGGKGAWEILDPGAVDAAEHGGHGHDKAKESGPKTRWAMLVDMRAMTEEKADKIREVCDFAHNIPHWDDPERELKWIWKEEYEHVFPSSYNEYISDDIKAMPFMLLCNHCDEPPCVRVCPVQATFRRPDGLVAQDYHRCIGCRFCMGACPYGSRSFNWFSAKVALEKEEGRKINKEFPVRTRGVVEKCNFCVERISLGKQPACVEACPDVMHFGNLADSESEIRKILRKRMSLRRKLELGTHPMVFYLV